MIRFAARAMINGKEHHLGRWPTMRQADIAVDRYALFLGIKRKLRWPGQSRRLGQASAEDLRAEARALLKKTATSRYLGVSWDQRTRSWRAEVFANGKTAAVGASWTRIPQRSSETGLRSIFTAARLA